MMDSLQEYIFGPEMRNALIHKGETGITEVSETEDPSGKSPSRRTTISSGPPALKPPDKKPAALRLDNFKDFCNLSENIKTNFERVNWAAVFIDSHLFLENMLRNAPKED